jgi:hypothetical protein
MAGGDVNVHGPGPGRQIRENNPMHSQSGRIGPIYPTDNLPQCLAKFVI